MARPSGSMPAWLAQAYPERRVTPERQRRLYGERYTHGPTSPVYRRYVVRIDRVFAERYRDYPRLRLGHVSNEYSGECHCDLC